MIKTQCKLLMLTKTTLLYYYGWELLKMRMQHRNQDLKTADRLLFVFKSFPVVTFLDIQLHWDKRHLPLFRKCLVNCEHLQLYIHAFPILPVCFSVSGCCFLLFRFYFLIIFCKFDLLYYYSVAFNLQYYSFFKS